MQQILKSTLEFLWRIICCYLAKYYKTFIKYCNESIRHVQFFSGLIKYHISVSHLKDFQNYIKENFFEKFLFFLRLFKVSERFSEACKKFLCFLKTLTLVVIVKICKISLAFLHNDFSILWIVFKAFEALVRLFIVYYRSMNYSESCETFAKLFKVCKEIPESFKDL